MLYWIISFSWFVVGTIAFWCILSRKWSKLDRVFVRIIETLRAMNPNIPGHTGYLDLKFSVIRHAAVTLISSAIIFLVGIRSIAQIVLFLNVLYAYAPISRYKSRKRYLQELRIAGHSDTASILSPLVRDSLCPIVHAIACVFILFILYGVSLFING